MAKEIELKAHVYDNESMKKVLMEKATYSCAFKKEDTYWALTESTQNPSCLPAPVSKIRLRKELMTFPDGSKKETTLATYKVKEITDGIEVNEEIEFAVTPDNEFERLLGAFGFAPEIRKRKCGWAFVSGEIKIELAEVEKLGFFIELEILSMHANENMIIAAKEKLLALLDDLGVNRDAIESRYYSQMLKDSGQTSN
ncbi:MAG: class IV adenylate cyclase [Treponema sp.]|nr:class IV adenylate cyclase [Treponema sp.]